jgi:hypothetical protein
MAAALAVQKVQRSNPLCFEPEQNEGSLTVKIRFELFEA